MVEEGYLKLILPLIGVLIGWALNNLSGYFKGRAEDKRLLSQSLVQLHHINYEMMRIINHGEFIKDISGFPSNYEEARQRFMNKFVLKGNSLEHSMEAVKNVSLLYPLIAIRLKSLIEDYSHAKQMKFSSILDKDKDMYVRYLSSFEVTFQLSQKELLKLIMKLAYRHSIFTGIRFSLMYKKLAKDNFAESALGKSLKEEAIKIVEKTRKGEGVGEGS